MSKIVLWERCVSKKRCFFATFSLLLHNHHHFCPDVIQLCCDDSQMSDLFCNSLVPVHCPQGFLELSDTFLFLAAAAAAYDAAMRHGAYGSHHSGISNAAPGYPSTRHPHPSAGVHYPSTHPHPPS